MINPEIRGASTDKSRDNPRKSFETRWSQTERHRARCSLIKSDVNSFQTCLWSLLSNKTEESSLTVFIQVGNFCNMICPANFANCEMQEPQIWFLFFIFGNWLHMIVSSYRNNSSTRIRHLRIHKETKGEAFWFVETWNSEALICQISFDSDFCLCVSFNYFVFL